MQILAIETELAPIDSRRHADVLRAEAECVWALKKAEVIRDIWFTRRGRNAVVMLECATEAEARRRLAALPLVRAGLIAFEVRALRSYDGFERLMAGRTPKPGRRARPARPLDAAVARASSARVSLRTGRRKN